MSNQEKIGPKNKKEEQLSIIINKSQIIEDQIIENDYSKKTKNKREKKNDVKKKNENWDFISSLL